jgi:hypothetical protein
MTPLPGENLLPEAQAAGSKRRKINMEPLVLLAFLVVWFVLQIWVLPKLGVRT